MLCRTWVLYGVHVYRSSCIACYAEPGIYMVFMSIVLVLLHAMQNPDFIWCSCLSIQFYCMLCRTRVLYGVHVYRSSFIACYAEPRFYMVFMSIILVLLHAMQNPGFIWCSCLSIQFYCMLCRTRVLYGVHIYRSSFIACYAEPGFYMVFMSIVLVLLHAMQNPGFIWCSCLSIQFYCMLCRTRVLYGVHIYRSSFIACYAEPGFYMVFMSIDLVLLHAMQNLGFIWCSCLSI